MKWLIANRRFLPTYVHDKGVKSLIYTVKSKKSLKELIEILEEESISLSYQDNHMLQVTSPTEKEFDIFSNLLAFYVSYTHFEEVLEEGLLKKRLTKQEAQSLTDEALVGLSSSNYFYAFTRVLVKDYFKKMDTFNVDSFLLFNMKGFKKEVKVFADTMIQHRNGYYSSEGEYEVSENPSMGEIAFQNVFFLLRERAIGNGLKIEEYQELHIFQKGEDLYFENSEGRLIDNHFFIEFMGSELEFEALDKVEDPALFEGMMTSSMLINIFEAKKVVIHSSLTEKARDVLLYNITSLKKETGKKIKVLLCNGCDKCK